MSHNKLPTNEDIFEPLNSRKCKIREKWCHGDDQHPLYRDLDNKKRRFGFRISFSLVKNVLKEKLCGQRRSILVVVPGTILQTVWKAKRVELEGRSNEDPV
ncbi:11488_t:CDS:2 [Ambispora leptoticha]|uniref:11488_t:CDS:1 n=1 Tax=Ambispora leptoticha TaxID=144679 RepID=A0A9N9HHC3_9GLOM|nr:11488_t:CDS:2 [Ambispora leptoticha]